MNTDSRMESHGEPGRIHVCPATCEKLQDQFLFEDRGAIAVKGKGEINTFFITGRKFGA